jgi:hypothetical protein
MQPPECKNPPEISSLAAEDLQEGDEAQNLDGRLVRYARARRRAEVNLTYLRALEKGSEGLPGFGDHPEHYDPSLVSKAVSGLQGCGQYLVFNHYFTVGKVRLSKASFCKQHLICPLCAIRRGAKSLRLYLDRWQHVQHVQQGLHLYMVTLTVKNGGELVERFTHLRDSVQVLMKRRHRVRQPSETHKALGGVMSFEVTNKGNGWHPHVHMVWACWEAPVQERLQEEWHQITGDSYIVDVRPFSSEQDPAEGFVEVFKYAMKFSDLSVEDNWQAAVALRGRRLLSGFGCFRGVVVPPELTDELLDDLPFIELLYRYRGGHYHFGG